MVAVVVTAFIRVAVVIVVEATVKVVVVTVFVRVTVVIVVGATVR